MACMHDLNEEIRYNDARKKKGEEESAYMDRILDQMVSKERIALKEVKKKNAGFGSLLDEILLGYVESSLVSLGRRRVPQDSLNVFLADSFKYNDNFLKICKNIVIYILVCLCLLYILVYLFNIFGNFLHIIHFDVTQPFTCNTARAFPLV